MKTQSISSFSSVSRVATASNNCHHKLPAKMRTVKVGANAGKKFFGCSRWPNDDCGMWHDEVYERNSNDELDDMHVKLMEKERTISQLLVKRKNIEDKLLKQKQKRAKADELVEDMRKELAVMHVDCGKHEKGEKFFAAALAISWIMFGIVLCIVMALFGM